MHHSIVCSCTVRSAITGRIDEVNGVLVLEEKGQRERGDTPERRERHETLQKWANQLAALSVTLSNKL